jgi:hypothetical protein
MFRSLFAHPQEALQKWHLIYSILVISVGCTMIEVELLSGHEFHFNPVAAN